MTEPRERPILFSAPMVRALLDGRKTMTRRVVKGVPGAVEGHFYSSIGVVLCKREDGRESLPVPCPFGVPGDRLWVKESLKRDFLPHLLTGEPQLSCPRVTYAADGAPALLPGEFDTVWPWKRPVLPSIHCPRWASRLTLEVTDVRVERLQDISEEDARAEGVRPSDAAVVFQGCGHWHDSMDEALVCHATTRRPDMENAARGAFAILWDSLNASRGFAWATNPWVWALTVSLVTPGEEAKPCA